MASIKDSLRLLAFVSFIGAFRLGPASFAAPRTAVQVAAAQDKPSPSGASSVVIHLEQRKGEKQIAVRPEHVFEPGDVVRFRLTSGFDGYLYVVDLGSSGTYTPLFPAAGTTSDNAIRKGVDALVPSVEDGWFQVEGPAGFDILYFLVSSTPIDVKTGPGAKADRAPSSAPAPLPSYLKPRCNDAIFQARGECIDDSAGPSPLSRDVTLPPQITMAVPDVSRDIVFATDDEDKSVKATAASDKPVVYVFRLAHH